MFRALIITLISLCSVELLAQNADDILGVWWTEEKDGKVEIYKMNGKYYGKLIWMDEPKINGKPVLDDQNPDPDLRDRPIEGIVLLKKLTFDGDQWDDGEVYDPESGDTYSCYIELESKNRLKLRGYLGFSVVGRSTFWTRVE
jgi:uncharacterized protein (DUF2147 family)